MNDEQHETPTSVVGVFPTAEQAKADAEAQLATRPERVTYLIGKLRGGARWVWVLADDHRAVVAPGAPYEGMVVHAVHRTAGPQPTVPVDPDLVVRVQTGVEHDPDAGPQGGWWIVVQTTYADDRREVQRWGAENPEGVPTAFLHEDDAVRLAAEASARFRLSMNEAGVNVVDGPGARAQRRAAMRAGRDPLLVQQERPRGPVIDLDAPAAGLWVPGQ